MTTSTGVRAPSPVLSHVELADAYAAGLSPEDLATFDHLRELHRSDDGLPHVLSDEQRRVLDAWHAFVRSTHIEWPPSVSGFYRPRTTSAERRAWARCIHAIFHLPSLLDVLSTMAVRAVHAAVKDHAGTARLVRVFAADSATTATRSDAHRATGSMLRFLVLAGLADLAPPVRSSHAMT